MLLACCRKVTVLLKNQSSPVSSVFKSTWNTGIKNNINLYIVAVEVDILQKFQARTFPH